METLSQSKSIKKIGTISFDDMDEMRHWVTWKYKVPYEMLYNGKDPWDDTQWAIHIDKWLGTDED